MKKAKIRCPNCGSSQAYLRLKTGQIVCNRCGEKTLVRKPPVLPGQLLGERIKT